MVSACRNKQFDLFNYDPSHKRTVSATTRDINILLQFGCCNFIPHSSKSRDKLMNCFILKSSHYGVKTIG